MTSHELESKKRPSTGLIVLSVAVLILCAIMIFFVYSTIKGLQNDALLINQAGVIRGSIQRVTKLVLSGSNESVDEITVRIDHLLKDFLSQSLDSQKCLQANDFCQKLHQLQDLWKDLSSNLTAYTNNPSPELQKAIMEKSEHCWHVADSTVLAAQLANEDKVGGISFIYYFLALNTLAILGIMWLVYSFVRKRLEYQAYFDKLTNVLNKNSYESTIENTLDKCRNHGLPMSLILFDIDHFKDINDRYGHKTGDKVLAKLTELAGQNIRGRDLLFRVGGEEFAVIAPETQATEALKLAERIRYKVAQESFGEIGQVTISLGVSEFNRDMTRDELYIQADKAMYRAKSSGRNRTEIYTSDGERPDDQHQ